MDEFSCFLHPQQRGESLEECCQICGEPFGFPLQKKPNSINGKPVIESLSRGFYGAVFVTQHKRTQRLYAVKIIPQATYASLDQGGYDKNFEEEARLHQELSSINIVASIQDWGEEVIHFGDHEIPSFWMEMEYVKGPTLAEKIQESPDDPREVAQIAWDLLDLVDAFQQRGKFHNDLHGRNIKVVSLKESEARRQAIHPGVTIKVLDIGSAADKSKSGSTRLGDVHWVARHILDLIDAYERFHQVIKPSTLRLCSQIRRVAEYYYGVDSVRRPTARDMKSAIHSAFSYAERPWNQPLRLGSVAEHYNAQTLPSWFAPVLFYDPEGKWARRLMGPGPQLVAGMRGCGKTMLLRSLEWVARTHICEGEDNNKFIERLKRDTFLGLFVSCASLLRSPRSASVDLPFHRLFLAFSREVIRNVHVCELKGIGVIDYNAIKPFSEMISRSVPWFVPPAETVDLVALERALSEAIQNPPISSEAIPEITPIIVFNDLVLSTRRLVDLWDGKILLFLLDDVSSRYLPSENVDEFLSQLCLQSPEFGFKISTEIQNIELKTPGGKSARSGRDYDIFYLGAEVFANVSGPSGIKFIEEVLHRRSIITDGLPDLRPSKVLGRQKLIDIAKAIQNQPNTHPVYWGIDALSGVCVGDIGDILNIYDRILSRAGNDTYPVRPKIQHEAITDFAEQKLAALAGQKEWLYLHAVAFADASHRELKKSASPRIRQYNEIFVKIDPGDAPDLFSKLMELIEHGVFVFTGGTPRTKTPHAAPKLQFKLAYHKVLGLTNRIPLSMRDRFELSSQRLDAWLNEPSGNKLMVSSKSQKAGQNVDVPIHEVNEVQLDDEDSPEPHATVQQSFSFKEILKKRMPQEKKDPEPRVLYEIETRASGEISSVQMDWTNKHVIGAFGFEPRSVGSWHNLLQIGKPVTATMLEYDNPGYAADIINVLSKISIPYIRVKTKTVMADDEATALINDCGNHGIVIDTTSLTKALIYTLIVKALILRNEVWVLHTCASEYHPSDADLVSVVHLMQSRKFPEVFRAIDDIVVGERGPYECVPVGPQYRDPSQPSLMVAFTSLKYDRVARLLEETQVEEIVAIAPIHTSGERTSRSTIGKFLAEYFVQRYGGSVYEVGSLDHDGAYRILRELHCRYALEGNYNFEIALTGPKMHTVGAAMMGATALPASVYVSSPTRYNPEKFTKGTAATRVIHLQRREQHV